MNKRNLIAALSVAVFSLLFYGSGKDGATQANSGGSSNSSPSRAPTSAPSAPPAQREYVTQNCSEVAHTFGTQAELSELQQNEMWRQYEGKWARWTVRVGEVSETLGQLSVQFRCGGESLLFDGHAYFPDSARQQLLTVRTNSRVSIECRLDDHGRLLGLALKDCELH
jgi:ABC-type uncharacterized transport system involved in gliding motility auxiliary subunit